MRLRTVDETRLDLAEGDAWTLRQVAFHLGSTYYADAVGDLRAVPGIHPQDDRTSATGR